MLVVAMVSGACVLSECSYVFFFGILFFVIFSAIRGEAAGCTYSNIWKGSTKQKVWMVGFLLLTIISL